MTNNVTFSSVSSPVYANSEHTAINCMVTLSDDSDHPYAGQTHPFTCMADDSETYGAELWTALQAGQYGSIAAYVAPTLTPLQLGIAAIAAGIVLTSTATPALNGIYPCDLATQAKVNAITTCILVTGSFPNNSSTQSWFDTEGTPHIFTNVNDFKNFAIAFINYVTPIDEYINSNGTLGSIPNNAITIA